MRRVNGSSSEGMTPNPTPSTLAIDAGLSVTPGGSKQLGWQFATPGGRVLDLVPTSFVLGDDVQFSVTSDGQVSGTTDSTNTTLVAHYDVGAVHLTSNVCAVACSALVLANEPAANVMTWFADPSHPLGFNQPGMAGPGGNHDQVTIVDAPWSPNGKAFQFKFPAAARAAITNIQPIVGGTYDGWTQITAPGFGTAYNASPYRDGAFYGGNGGALTVFYVDGALGVQMNTLQLQNLALIGGTPTVALDADNVAVAFNSAALAAYTGGGTVGFYGGFGVAVMGPLSSTFNTMYNTTLYVAIMQRFGDPANGFRWPANLGAGTKECFGFGAGLRQYSSSYGASWTGPWTDNTRELDSPIGIGADWSAHGAIGGGAGGGTVGPPSLTPGAAGVFARGDVILSELEYIGNTDADNDGIARIWYNKDAASAPDYENTGTSFTSTQTGYVPRSFTIWEVDNVDGGGGMLPDIDKIVQIAFIKVSVGYARAGEQPDHWDLAVNDPGGALPRTVTVTATLKDANGDTIRTVVNPTPNGNCAAYGDADIDVQADANNGGSWSVIPGSWGDAGGGATPEEQDARAGQIGFAVVLNNAGTTHFKMRDISRGLNYQRFGAWRESGVDLAA